MSIKNQTNIPRREVAYFAEEMERELQGHADQFAGDTALGASMPELFNYLSVHGAKLREAIEKGDRAEIKKQTVHISNYAMFVRQVCEPYHEAQLGGMTVTKLRLYCFIRAYIQEHKVSPTYQEMADFMDYNSRGFVLRLTQDLVDMGYLKVTGKSRSRNLALTGKEAKL